MKKREKDVSELIQRVCIHPCTKGLHGKLSLPSSKYHTLRFILLAFLASGVSTINYPALSDDTDVLLAACRALGAQIETETLSDGQLILHVQGTGGVLRMPSGGEVSVGNAGAVLRMLLGLGALAPEAITFTTPYLTSLGKRPNDDLLDALKQLGVEVTGTNPEGMLPVTLRGGAALRGGPVRVSGRKSSQYLSALLFLGPLLPDGLEIEIIDRLTSASFVDLTIQILATAGITIRTLEYHRRYSIPGGQSYRAGVYTVPGDYPSAAAILSALAVTGGEITLSSLEQNDPAGQAVLDAFASMGMEISRQGQEITARVTGRLYGLEMDGNMVIDSVPVIVAAASFASTPSSIYNVANLRFKESDRSRDLADELNRLGCQVKPLSSILEVCVADPGTIRGGTEVESHSDHRLIQALTIVGLGAQEPVVIQQAQHIAKSYPNFFADLTALGASFT